MLIGSSGKAHHHLGVIWFGHWMLTFFYWFFFGAWENSQQEWDVQGEKWNILLWNKFNFLLIHSFGHSCYGGFGKKRSDPAVPLDPQSDFEASQQNSATLMKRFSEFNSLPSPQQLQLLEEKEVKLIILSTLSQVVEETLKKVSIEVEK